MSEMVERVARAIMNEAKSLGAMAHHVGGEHSLERRLARAAIEAMRDSLTPEFATAIMDASSYIDWKVDQSNKEEWYGDYWDFRQGWVSAFDAALKD